MIKSGVNISSILIILLAFIISGCNEWRKQEEDTLFILKPSNSTGIDFNNLITENDELNIVSNYDVYNGAGVGIGDFNNDGLPDIFFGGNMVSSRLYLNKGDLTFADITETSNTATKEWVVGVSVVDINADGWQDLYLSVGVNCKNGCQNILFLNKSQKNADVQFERVPDLFGLSDDGFTTHTAFLDYDLDGDLDAYLIKNKVDLFSKVVAAPKNSSMIAGRTRDLLYRNNGLGENGYPVFMDASQEAGIIADGWSLGVAINDVNGDGWPDIYVSNDFFSDDLLYINQKNGKFLEQGKKYLKHATENAMGVDMADINNDGWPDIMTLDMLPQNNQRQKATLLPMNYNLYSRMQQLGYLPQFMRNTLQLNNGISPGQELLPFSEIGQMAGVYQTDWSWAPLMADFDNDGLKDIFISNGFVKNVTDMDFVNYYRGDEGANETAKSKNLAEVYNNMDGIYVPNYMYKNEGGLRFTDHSSLWGILEPSFSNGAAFVDLDKDGDLDLIVNNINDVAHVYENTLDTSKKHFIQVRLEGPEMNPMGLGTKIYVHSKGKLQYHYQSLYRGYGSTVDATVHFGLGTSEVIDSISVTWPGSKSEVLRNVRSDQLITIDHKNGAPNPEHAITPSHTFHMKEMTGDIGLSFTHQENEFVDFNIQPLLLKMHSKLGPSLAVGDVNGDDLDDFFVGGASGFFGKFFIQQQSGQFEEHDLQYDQPLEDTGSLLFDFDNDDDLDLYVTTGGSSFPFQLGMYEDRLYINDGQGGFIKSKGILPQINMSGSSVSGADYDKDGDIDLFIAGRVMPGYYPLRPHSYLLENEDGKFKQGQTFRDVGMVSSALWTDFDNDGWQDIIIVGEWMPVTCLRNNYGEFEKLDNTSIGLMNTNGWWNSIASGDFDNDMDTDYILGNFGENTRYNATPDQPMKLYGKDIDNNGTVDPIISQYHPDENGDRKAFPLHTRDAIVSQLPHIKRNFGTYKSFGKAEFNTLFPQDQLKGALMCYADNLSSLYVENLGGSKFRVRKLPAPAQISPVTGIQVYDINYDGNLDVLIQGNDYSTELIGGIQDASLGLVLEGDGNGNFSPVPPRFSGLLLDGDRRALSMIHINGKPALISTENSGQLTFYSLSDNVGNLHVNVKSEDSYALIRFKNGKTRKEEFHFGEGYLSQSSQDFYINSDSVEAIEIFDRGINLRTVPISN
ncbi:RNA-binding protein [Fulvivirga sp. M361]|nr:RNA-binding protein [Fulvivirga sp. M361]